MFPIGILQTISCSTGWGNSVQINQGVGTLILITKSNFQLTPTHRWPEVTFGNSGMDDESRSFLTLDSCSTRDTLGGVWSISHDFWATWSCPWLTRDRMNLGGNTHTLCWSFCYNQNTRTMLDFLSQSAHTRYVGPSSVTISTHTLCSTSFSVTISELQTLHQLLHESSLRSKCMSERGQMNSETRRGHYH